MKKSLLSLGLATLMCLPLVAQNLENDKEFWGSAETIILGIYLLMYLENMIFYTFDGFFSIAHTIHIVFIVFWSSSRKRAACPPSICTWWNWKEMGKVVLSQPLR